MNLPRQRKATARTWLIGVVGLGVAVIGLKLTVFNRDARPYEIEWTEIDSGPVVMTIETNGTVEPMSTIQVGCETTGRIMEIAVGHDDPVTKGQVICRIDPELVDAQHAQSVAERNRAVSALADAEIAREEQKANLPVAITQAQAKLQEAEAGLTDAEYRWNRVQGLREQGNATEAEWTAAKAGFERAQAAKTAATAAHTLAQNNQKYLAQHADQAVEQAKAARMLAEARFKMTKTQVDKCVIRSPIDGIVLDRYMDVGVTVNATFQTPPLFLLAPSLDRMRVNAKVSESDIVHVAEGQIARFTIDAKGTKEFEGRILEKRSQPEIIQNVVTYTVIFEVDNDEARTLLPGLTVNLEIECVSRVKTGRIANAALRFKPPITLDERRAMIDAAQWPDRPDVDADGKPLEYCYKAHAWSLDEAAGVWSLVPLWVGITDNSVTEVIRGAGPGIRVVRKFKLKEDHGFSLETALKLADPANRAL